MRPHLDGFDLAWPATSDVVGYRVVVRDGTWQVLVQNQVEGKWKPYLPQLVVVDEELAAQPELSWPEVASALAYRVLVRDEHTRKPVLKQAFLSSPGRIDWSRLDPSHVHRARVQTWVDGEWRDHVSYRAVCPPRERIAGAALELAWPAAHGADCYRVSVRAEGADAPLLALEIDESPLLLPAAILPQGARCEWRVSVRRAPDGPWETYLPDIALAEQELAAQPEITWDEAPEALAYRVVVRDVERGEAVSKRSFLRSPGRVDWSRLDTAHPHRARIEAWVDGGWRRHGPSTRVFPPPRRILQPVAPESADRLKHVVVVRFPAHMLDATYGVERPGALHASRLNLLASWTLPSLELLSARDVDWYVAPDADLPEPVARSLVELCGERVLAPGDDSRQIVSDDAQGIAVAWLLAGDALHPGVPAAVERRAAALGDASEPLGVEFPLCVEVTPAGARLARDPSPSSLFVIVGPSDRPVRPANPRHPRLRLGSLARTVSDWSVPALLRARPGPNEHPIFLRERGPVVEPELLEAFGVDPACAATAAVSGSVHA